LLAHTTRQMIADTHTNLQGLALGCSSIASVFGKEKSS
jgi:hypothetical protein